METEPQPPKLSERELSEVGLSTACLVFGALAVLLCPIGVGALFGAAGLVSCHRYSKRGFKDSRAVRWGQTLSTIGLAIGLAFGLTHAERLLRGSAHEEPLQAWQGVPAPPFRMRLVDGRETRLSDYRGRRVALVLWATWCPPCRREIPILSQIHRETSRDELVIIGLSVEEPEVVAAFAKREGIDYLIATPAEELPRPIAEVRAIPSMFVIDRKGVIQSVATGLHSYEELKAMLLAADYTGPVKSPPPVSTDGAESW